MFFLLPALNPVKECTTLGGTRKLAPPTKPIALQANGQAGAGPRAAPAERARETPHRPSPWDLPFEDSSLSSSFLNFLALIILSTLRVLCSLTSSCSLSSSASHRTYLINPSISPHILPADARRCCIIGLLGCARPAEPARDEVAACKAASDRREPPSARQPDDRMTACGAAGRSRQVLNFVLLSAPVGEPSNPRVWVGLLPANERLQATAQAIIHHPAVAPTRH